MTVLILFLTYSPSSYSTYCSGRGFKCPGVPYNT